MNRLPIILIFGVLFLAASAPTSNTAGEKEITWYSMEEAQQLAREHGKKVLVYALAEWCGYCKKMEKEVYPEQDVINTLAKYYYPVRLDIESDREITFNNEVMTESQFALKFRISGTPTFYFLDDQGEMLGAQPGFIPADTFNNLLIYVGSGAFMEVKFDEFMKRKHTDSGSK